MSTKLEGDRIVIEHRDELDVLDAMIECYFKHGRRIPEREKEDLQKLKNDLTALWYSW